VKPKLSKRTYIYIYIYILVVGWKVLSSSGTEESERLSVKGMSYAERAVAAGPENFACHKWMGVLINYSSGFEGYKRKIERSFEIKEYFEVYCSHIGLSMC